MNFWNEIQFIHSPFKNSQALFEKEALCSVEKSWFSSNNVAGPLETKTLKKWIWTQISSFQKFFESRTCTQCNLNKTNRRKFSWPWEQYEFLDTLWRSQFTEVCMWDFKTILQCSSFLSYFTVQPVTFSYRAFKSCLFNYSKI